MISSASRLFVALFLVTLIWTALAPNPARAVGELAAMSLLGVGSDQRAEQIPGQPGAAPDGAAGGAAEAPGTDCLTAPQRTELIASLHKGGEAKRVALIVRGSNFGIHPYVQQFIGRLASALGGDAGLAAFLKENLEKTYISDERETRAYLERMGYEVKVLSSAELGRDPAGFKSKVLAELEKKETSMFFFYGHGSPGCIQLWGGREHQAPGPKEIQDMLEGKEADSTYLTPAEITGALAKRGDAGKLDAMVLHSCRGATYPYTHAGNGSWADCVKEDGIGFFAGWVTYAVYFTAKTSQVLDAYFCHAAQVDAKAPAADLQKTARFYKKSNPMLRKMALIAGMDDELSIQDEHGGNYAAFDADAAVHEHVETQITALKGLEALIDLAYGLLYGKTSLGGDLKSFFTAFTAYQKEAGVNTSRGGRPAPRISSPPTRDEINALLAFHGPETIAEGLGSLMPGLLVLKYGQAWLDDQDVLQIDLSADINKAKDVDALLDIVSGAYTGKAEGAIVGALPPVVGTDPLTNGTHVFGLGIGPDLASRVKSTIATVRAKLPDQVLALRVRMSLEKVPAKDAWIVTGGSRKRAKSAVRPLVYGYNLAVGAVPQAKKDSRASPYEIHVALASVNAVVKPLVMGMLGNEIELEYIYNPGRFLPNIKLYAYVKLFDMGDITGSGQTLSGSATVQLRVNWGPFGNGYAYATFNGSCNVTTPGGLQVGLAPTGTITGVSGLPGPGWLQTVFVGLAQGEVNTRLAQAVPGTVDIATLIPAEFRDQIAGKIKIAKIEAKDGILSIYMDHAR